MNLAGIAVIPILLNLTNGWPGYWTCLGNRRGGARILDLFTVNFDHVNRPGVKDSDCGAR
jgi:hypothetical protein